MTRWGRGGWRGAWVGVCVGDGGESVCGHETMRNSRRLETCYSADTGCTRFVPVSWKSDTTSFYKKTKRYKRLLGPTCISWGGDSSVVRAPDS